MNSNTNFYDIVALYPVRLLDNHNPPTNDLGARLSIVELLFL